MSNFLTTIAFDKLQPGTKFVFDGQEFIKLKPLPRASVLFTMFNACCLSDGGLWRIAPCTECTTRE